MVFCNDKFALVNVSLFVVLQSVTRLLQITLPRLAGVSDQCGDIFEFAPKANDDTGTILKGEGVCEAKRRKLVNSPFHNLSKEWSVEFINYESKIFFLPGKQYLEGTLRKIIVNKSSGILDQAVFSGWRKFSKPVKEIKESKIECKKKIKLYQKETYSEGTFGGPEKWKDSWAFHNWERN